MYIKKVTVLAKSVIQMLPRQIQRLVFKTIKELRFTLFLIKLKFYHGTSDSPSHAKIYWISPQRIVYHTNYTEKGDGKDIPFWNRVFKPNMRGKVVDGNWDITNFRFTDLPIYKAFWQRIKEGVEWEDMDLYKFFLKNIKSGKFLYSIRDGQDLKNRFDYLDTLYENIKNNGYRLNRSILQSFDYDEIDVNIGRNGEYLFQNGAHRLSIAKILGIEKIPVMVFVRHKKWVEFRKFVIQYAKQQPKGKLYQPLCHPDLEDIPYEESHDWVGLMEVIKRHLGKKRGIMLDIGANLGFFCHKFEDLGYKCYAVESDPVAFRILEKVKIAENKKFEAINKSIFDVEFVKKIKFDVVLALNVFHHFLKRKTDFCKLKDLLKNLKMDVMFFEPHLYKEEQMKDAYVNFTEAEFVNFMLQHTSLKKAELIYTEKNGRKVFKLS